MLPRYYGTVVPLGEGAIFERTVSEKEGLQATILVFPAVEVGAILDYSYEIRFDSIWFLEPWYFQDRYPVEFSKIVYHLPADIATVSWGQATFDKTMEHESVKEPGGSAVKVWMRQLPAIPREELAQPFEDMSSRFMVLPTYLVESGRRVNLLESRATTCALVDDYVYSPYWARARKAKVKTKELISGVSGVVAKIDALFVFVRDTIDSLGCSGITPYRDTVDALLAEGSGSSADKTLMLHKMLEIAGVRSEIVWIADRSSGRIDPQVANPGWFDRPILRVAVGVWFSTLQ